MIINSLTNKEILDMPDYVCIRCMNCHYIDIAMAWKISIKNKRYFCPECRNCAKEKVKK